MSSLPANFQSVRTKMAEAALRSGRKVQDVTLVAVSKSVDNDTVLRAMAECDQQLFGENRADELVRKVDACEEAATRSDESGNAALTTATTAIAAPTATAEFHFIGPLQTNKVRKVVGNASLIHSVDSERLLRAIDARARLKEIVQPILIQIDISKEAAKQGIDSGDLDALLHIANSELSHVQVNGLMTMAPFIAAEDVRWIFEDLRELRDRTDADGPHVALRELSMGMTGDFEVAIEEGATLVRVGTALFV